MKKKTPKNSKKTGKKAKEKKENIIVAGIFVVFIVVMIYLIYFVQMLSSDEATVAIVNGNKITRDELDWWYKTSILPEYRDAITKQDFLIWSLIPQEVLLQKAKEENIIATEDEVEKLLGMFIIESGLTLNEFEEDLNSRGITINEIKKSFEVRAIITKLLEEEEVYFSEEGEKSFLRENDLAFQEYLGILINNSKIEILPENIDKLILRSFEATGDDLCGQDRPIMRLYTTSKCEICKESGRLFQDSVIDFIADGSIQARHWSLDTGDNLLTLKKENGVPKEEVALFKKYSPDNLVPTIVLGCKYKHVGKFGIEQEEEFKAILKTLIDG
jgi:hypothetical protein